MSNIVASIINYVANVWHNTDQDYVMAEHINAWEQELQNVSQFLSRYAWHPNTAYPKGSVILYPFGLNTKLVSQNAGTSGSNEPTWSDAQGQEGSRTVTDNDIIWKEMPMEISSDVTPIGTIKQQLWHTAPPGYIKLDVSQVLNRADYPELWQYVQNYMPLISEVDWQKQAAKQNTVGFFSSGDGSTTFRTPVIVDFARGGVTSNVGKYAADQNKQHKHTATVQINAVGDHYHTFGYHTGNNSGYFLTTPGITKLASLIAQARAGKWNGNGGGGINGWDGGSGTTFSPGQNLITSKVISTETASNSVQISNSGGSEVMPKNIIMPYFLRALNI